MSRKNFYLCCGFLIGFLIGLSIIYSIHLRKIKKQIPKPKIITKTIIKQVKVPESVISEQKLAQWIYKNSYRCSRKQAMEYAKIIIKVHHPLLVAAIIKNESSFNPTAVSKANAIGLMQVLPTPQHIKQLQKAGIIKETRDLFEPETNIRAGVYLFDDMLKLNNNNISRALTMYVGGSKSYVRAVLQTLGQLTIEVKDD